MRFIAFLFMAASVVVAADKVETKVAQDEIAPMYNEVEGKEYPVVAKEGKSYHQVFVTKGSGAYFADSEGESIPVLDAKGKTDHELFYVVQGKTAKDVTYKPLPKGKSKKSEVTTTAGKKGDLETHLVNFGYDYGYGDGYDYGVYGGCFRPCMPRISYPIYGCYGGYGYGGGYGFGGGCCGQFYGSYGVAVTTTYIVQQPVCYYPVRYVIYAGC